MSDVKLPGLHSLTERAPLKICSDRLLLDVCSSRDYEAGFPGGSVVKNPPAAAGDAGSIPGWGRSPGEGNSNPIQDSFFFFNYLFYFWLHWVFVAVQAFSIAVSVGTTLVDMRRLLLLQGIGSRRMRFNSCSSWTWLLRGMQNFPGPGIKPVSPALAGRFLSTVPPGKSPNAVLLPGKSHGQRILVGYSPWGHKRVGDDLATKEQQQGY